MLGLSAIAAGKHVLIEKPIAISATEAEEIAAAVRSAGVLAAEAMWTRYLPQFNVLHRPPRVWFATSRYRRTTGLLSRSAKARPLRSAAGRAMTR